jgi:hypothetical protein
VFSPEETKKAFAQAATFLGRSFQPSKEDAVVAAAELIQGPCLEK